MKISKKSDIAIRVLLHMRSQKIVEPHYASANQIAETLDVSYNHIRKIISELNELGLITSRLGKTGGIALTENYNQISIKTLLIQLEEFEQTGTRLDCDACNHNHSCHFEHLLRSGLHNFFDTFEGVYLDDL